MSNRNNDVFQVLVTKGNLALLPAGALAETLAVGQLGVFDLNTQLSVTGTVPKDYYFALGVDPNGGGVLGDIKMSAGQFIRANRVVDKSFKPHSAGRPKIVKIGGYTAQSDTEYGLRVELRNSKIYRIQGSNQFSESYTMVTPYLATPGPVDSNLITQGLVTNMNGDTVNPKVIAQPIARQALTAVTHGTSVNYAAGAVMTDADVKALLLYNAVPANAATKVYTDLQLTSIPVTLRDKNVVSLGYHTFLQTDIIVATFENLKNGGAITTITQDAAYEEGSGVNIQHKEYHASNWNGAGPYVVSDTTGVAKFIPTLALVNGTYDQFILQYVFKSESGWKQYESTLSTIFAIPEADTVTRNSLATVLDVLTAGGGYEALADDAAAANVTPTVVEAIVTDSTKDGIA